MHIAGYYILEVWYGITVSYGTQKVPTIPKQGWRLLYSYVYIMEMCFQF